MFRLFKIKEFAAPVGHLPPLPLLSQPRQSSRVSCTSFQSNTKSVVIRATAVAMEDSAIIRWTSFTGTKLSSKVTIHMQVALQTIAGPVTAAGKQGTMF